MFARRMANTECLPRCVAKHLLHNRVLWQLPLDKLLGLLPNSFFWNFYDEVAEFFVKQ